MATGNIISRTVAAVVTVMALLASVGVGATNKVSAVDSAAHMPQSVGLVLSGGGAKGIAHIGVIKALEENDIPIDYIAGTSMGSIVGGLYAAGYTTDEMLELIQSKDFSYWSTGKIDMSRTYYFLQEPAMPTLVTLNLGESDSTRWSSVLPSSLINPLPMNYAFMELFAKYTAQCDGNFDRLFVPFRCVASDVKGKHKVVFGSGSLGDAIRASMSFPLVFAPIEIDGVRMYDGGIYDNFPVDVMRDTFAPQIMIGVDVSSSDASEPTDNMLDQLETMIIQRSDHHLPARQGIRMKVNLDRFGLLDFAKCQEIYRIGYDHAMSMMDSIKSRVHSRMPRDVRELERAVFKSQTPYVRFDSVTVTGGSASQDAYLRSMFPHGADGRTDTFGLEQARESFYRAITPGKLRNLLPQARYRKSDGLFSLDLKATVKDKVDLGVGGYFTTSTNSMLFLTTGYRTLNFNSLDLRVNGWVGQSYLAAQFRGQIRFRSHLPSSVQIQGVVSRLKSFPTDRFFFQTSDPTRLVSEQFFGRLSYACAVGSKAKAEAGGGYGYMKGRYYGDSGESGRISDVMTQNMGQVFGRLEYSTLNDASVPTAGTYVNVSVLGVTGRHRTRPGAEETPTLFKRTRSWGQAEVNVRHFFSFSDHVSLGLHANLLASSRRLLPTYVASIVDAPAYVPTASFSNVFSPEFRANSFGVAGIDPVVSLGSMFQIRGQVDAFMALREIEALPDGGARYGDYCSRLQFFGKLEGVLTTPLGTISAYAHYSTAANGRWNFGLSFGVPLMAPDFMR